MYLKNNFNNSRRCHHSAVKVLTEIEDDQFPKITDLRIMGLKIAGLNNTQHNRLCPTA